MYLWETLQFLREVDDNPYRHGIHYEEVTFFFTLEDERKVMIMVDKVPIFEPKVYLGILRPTVNTIGSLYTCKQ